MIASLRLESITTLYNNHCTFSTLGDIFASDFLLPFFVFSVVTHDINIDYGVFQTGKGVRDVL